MAKKKKNGVLKKTGKFLWKHKGKIATGATLAYLGHEGHKAEQQRKLDEEGHQKDDRRRKTISKVYHEKKHQEAIKENNPWVVGPKPTMGDVMTGRAPSVVPTDESRWDWNPTVSTGSRILDGLLPGTGTYHFGGGGAVEDQLQQEINRIGMPGTIPTQEDINTAYERAERGDSQLYGTQMDDRVKQEPITDEPSAKKLFELESNGGGKKAKAKAKQKSTPHKPKSTLFEGDEFFDAEG